MRPETWQRVQELFHAALERQPEERTAFLAAECRGERQLREQVERLLADHGDAGDFLESSPLEDLHPTGDHTQPAAARVITFGPYRSVRELGRGGMGSVYLADRTDGQFHRQVAIKVVHPGIESEDILRRFHQEGQILANLDHANIAGLFDGGTTDDGRPYFVMEYIEGEAIDEYCDTRRLSIDDRLALFCDVCDAVDFAHQHNVVHRDLKPTNILVTADGVPKLLDFGVAKILQPELFPFTVAQTRTNLWLMTPEYASPEQVLGKPITPATDVFALGVVLYELLTGRRPLELKVRSVSEIVETVSKVYPPTPSSAISPLTDSKEGYESDDSLTGVCAARATTRRELRHRLAGDVDGIVMMALRKRPEKRYPSAAALADDIRRHQSGLPVRTRQVTAAYRSGRFLRRRLFGSPASVVTTAAVAILVLWLTALLSRPLLPDRIAQWIPVVSTRQATSGPGTVVEDPLFAFKERDWILVTDFENVTDDPQLDETVESLLTQELGRSRYLNLVPRYRVHDALRLIGEPPDSLVTAPLGREVALLDRDIRLLLSGRVEKIGSRTLLTVGLVDPVQGATVASFTEESADSSELVSATRRLSVRIRQGLGEDPHVIEATESALAGINIPSALALQLFAEAEAAIQALDNPVAEQLLILAIEDDPDFASAYIYLAHAVRNQRRPEKEYLDFAERALELSGTASEQEQLFIRGSYDHMLRNYDEAISTYRALLAKYPDHYWANNNLAALYASSAMALPYVTKLVDLRPFHFDSNWDAAWILAIHEADPDAAEPYVERARELLTVVETPGGHSYGSGWVLTFPARRLWLAGKLREAESAANILLSSTLARSEPGGLMSKADEGLARSIGNFLLTLGKHRAAEDVFLKLGEPAFMHENLTRVAFFRGDKEALRRHLLGALDLPEDRRDPDNRDFLMPQLLARADLTAQLQQVVLSVERSNPMAGYVELAQGELAAVSGQTTEAIRLLQQGIGLLRMGNGAHFLATETLSRALQEQGDLRGAIEVLSRTRNQRIPAVFASAGAFWIHCQAELARLYRETGQDQNAAEIEASLLELLSLADPDHPILVDLSHLAEHTPEVLAAAPGAS
jgi:serine/threonine protein kinase/tetratricopeptide (TPR) repeat protein